MIQKDIHQLLRLTICIVLILSFSSCKKKPHTGEPYEISGHVYDGCPKQPRPNIEIDLSWYRGGFVTSGTGGSIGSAVTDSNGYFKIIGDIYSGDITLRCDNELVMTAIKPENHYDFDIHQSPSTTLKINLNVSNPYSANDTLFVSVADSSGQQLKVAGPFNSGFLYTVSKYSFNETIIQNTSIYGKPYVTYHVNRNTNSEYGFINLNLCDTSTVTLDIK